MSVLRDVYAAGWRDADEVGRRPHPSDAGASASQQRLSQKNQLYWLSEELLTEGFGSRSRDAAGLRHRIEGLLKHAGGGSKIDIAAPIPVYRPTPTVSGMWQRSDAVPFEYPTEGIELPEDEALRREDWWITPDGTFSRRAAT